jgi:hypothetical protein
LTEDASTIPIAERFKDVDFESISDAAAIISCTLDLSNADKVVVK